MFKVISMCDKNYFPYGKLFIKTRKRVNANFAVYGPDLSEEQIQILKNNDIEYYRIEKSLYETQMQFLKFHLFIRQLSLNNDKLKQYSGLTFADFDTFFINDWNHIFNNFDFDFGITIRNDMVKKRCFRAYTNGGVILVKPSVSKFLYFAESVIKTGKSKELPEYDRIWKTLEQGRPKHKTHHRKNLRWWVDQVFLSALALKYFERYGYEKIGIDPLIFTVKNKNIALFGCQHYNVIGSKPDITKKKGIYIRHLKSTGRKQTAGKDITKEKLEKK